MGITVGATPGFHVRVMVMPYPLECGSEAGPGQGGGGNVGHRAYSKSHNNRHPLARGVLIIMA